jgi:uncharacterized membrane protein
VTRLDYLWNRYSTMAFFIIVAVGFLVAAVVMDRPWGRVSMLMGAIGMGRLAWGERPTKQSTGR